MCCFAWNLDKLATEAEKAQPVLSDIIGAMCLYMCLAEQHQMPFDMVLSKGYSLLCAADSQLNRFYKYIGVLFIMPLADLHKFVTYHSFFKSVLSIST